MKVSTRASAAYVLSLILCTVLLLAMALPAAAAKPAGKGNKAKSHRTTTTAVTEDTDTNDGDTPNNVADDGDNKHPSGKDKSVERGGSGNQGNSTSDPDDDGRGPDRSNGGADKPDGPGGVDLADQDGNNGCGNDDDFEDDNEGWCGAKPKPETPAAEPAEQPAAEDGSCTPGTVGCAPAKDEDAGSCTVGSSGCTPDVEETCDVASGECLGHADGECGAVASDCPSDDDAAGSDADAPSVTDKDLAAGPEGDVLGAEGSVEGETDVAGVTVERPAVDAVVGRVLGADATAADLAAVAAGGLSAAASRSLAATGSPMLVLGLLALGGMGLGAGLLRRTRQH